MTCTCGNARWVRRIEAEMIEIRRRVRSFETDNRLLPEFGPRFWTERTSERDWHHCKYCCRNVPTFTLKEGEMGQQEPSQILRCCWECGSGLKILAGRAAA